MNNETMLSATHFRPRAINHAMVVATWELPYNGGKLILTEQHSEAVVAAHRAAGMEAEPYRMYQEVDSKIDNVGDFSTMEEAKEYFHEVYDEVIYAHERDAYYAEYVAEKSMKNRIDEVRQENIDRNFDKWLDQFEHEL